MKQMMIPFLVVSALLCPMIATAEAEPKPESNFWLERWDWINDANGHTALWLEFGNHSEHVITLQAVQVERGSWAGFRQRFEPAEVTPVTIAAAARPAYIKISTSEGEFKVDLIPERKRSPRRD
jgi:hypothetical protein